MDIERWVWKHRNLALDLVCLAVIIAAVVWAAMELISHLPLQPQWHR